RVRVVLDVAVVRVAGSAVERLVLTRDGRVARSGGELVLRVRRRELRGVLGDGLGRGGVGELFELRLRLVDDRVVLRVRLVQRQLLMGGHAAVARARQRGVRAALAVRQDGGAAAGEVLAVGALAAERGLGLLLRELGIGGDVDLPAREARGEAGVHALLADRERELVVGDDDGGLLALVVEVDLAHAGRRQRLRDEPSRLGVPRDDVDLLAAELRHDHAHARAARPDTRADRVDALRVRLDGDLRPVPRLAGDAADLDEPVGDLRHLELEQRLDQLRIAAREDHLRALRAGAHLADDGLDARALLVALAVDLLGPGQQRLDLAEVDEDVPAVARLLDDPGDDLADAVDVLVVHHLALRLADPLQDHLLRRLCGDAPEVVGRDVLARHELLGNVGPVDLEVVVREQRVVLFAGLLFDALELLERALTCFLEQPCLDVRRKVDRVDAEVTAVVELDRRVPRRTGRLLVGGEQRVLECGDERPALDALLALDLANGFNDFLTHPSVPSSIKLARTISSYGMSTASAPLRICTAPAEAPRTSPRTPPAAVLTRTLRPTARSKCGCVRSGRSNPGDDTSTV